MNSKAIFAFLSQIVMILSLALFPLTQAFAKTGCCSRHGGVNGCNSSTGYQLCKDGTTSPSCACEGMTPAKKKAIKASTKATTPAPEPVAASAAKPSKVKTAGCCSRHGGVAQCNKSAGFFMCKDGSQSTTCSCS